MTTQPRTPRGSTTAGQFAPIARSEADVQLIEPGAIDGWSMRRYRVLGTDSAGHVSYSALVTHAGRPRLHVTATGDSPATITPVDEASAAAFTRAAQHLIGDDTGAAAELLRVITLAHTLREEARLAAVDLDSIIEVRHVAGTLTDAEYNLLSR